MEVKEIYQKVLKNKQAMGAFNFYNMETLEGILEGAKKVDFPVICAVSESALTYMGNYLMPMIKSAKEKYSFPIILHLDHGKSFEICQKAIDMGFDSVMVDGSYLPLEDNILETKKVVDYAHEKGVFVEGELGKLAGIEDNVSSSQIVFTNPAEAKYFVEKTGVDSLAIAIGTSHGAFKFSGEPTLRIDILKEIEKILPDFPLVLHGASSVSAELLENFNKAGGVLKNAKGVSEDLLKKVCLNHNIVKINVDTDLRIAFTGEVRKMLGENLSLFSPRDYLSAGKNAIANEVERKMKLFSSK